MDHAEDVVRGVLKPDGTLELAGRPNLPAGAVEVTIRAVPGISTQEEPAPRKESLWEFMQRTRAEREASGEPFRTKEEIDAEIEELRDWDGKIDEIERERDRRRAAPR